MPHKDPEKASAYQREYQREWARRNRERRNAERRLSSEQKLSNKLAKQQARLAAGDFAFPVVSQADAKAQGLMTYFTGRPCKNGHIAPRYTASGVCKGCNGAWAKANKEWVAAYQAEWAKANPEKVKAKQARHDLKSPVKLRVSKSRLKHLDKRRAEDAAHKRKVRAADPVGYIEYQRGWRDANPEKVANYLAKRRLLVDTEISVGLFKLLLSEQNYKCPYCLGKFSKSLPPTTDHYFPLQPRTGARRGSHTDDNIQLTCRDCNSRKSDKEPMKFLLEVLYDDAVPDRSKQRTSSKRQKRVRRINDPSQTVLL